jgi:hypothetical protein
MARHPCPTARGTHRDGAGTAVNPEGVLKVLLDGARYPRHDAAREGQNCCGVVIDFCLPELGGASDDLASHWRSAGYRCGDQVGHGRRVAADVEDAPAGQGMVQ